MNLDVAFALLDWLATVVGFESVFGESKEANRRESRTFVNFFARGALS